MAVCGCRRMQSQESMFFHGYITVKKVLSAHLACLAAVVNLAKNQLREVLIAPSSLQVQQTCGVRRHCSAEAARLGLRVRRSAVAVRSSSGPTVGIAAAHGPAPPLRRCCTRHTVPRLHRKKLRQLHTDRARVGGRWPRHLTPSCTHPSPHPKPRYDPVMCRLSLPALATSAVLGLNAPVVRLNAT